MGLQMDAQIEVTSFRSSLALALDPNARALGDAGGDLDLDLAPRRSHSGAAAGRAGHAFHDGAIAHLAPFGDKARAATGGTGFGHLGLNRPFTAARGFLQGDLDGMLDVFAPLPHGGPAPRSLEPKARETAGLAGGVGVEEVAEIAEARGASGGPATGLGLVLARKLLLALDPLPVSAHLVVLRSLLGIAQHLVGFVDYLEPIGGLWVLVDVRVVLAGQAPIGGLDLLLGRGPGDAEGLVVVLVLRGSHICVSRLMPIVSIAQTRRPR